MRIGCVSYHWGTNEVGGAQVPCVAFSKWCHILGVEADLLAFTASGRPSKNFVDPGQYDNRLKIQTYRKSDYFSVLNSYDALFLSTTGEMYNSNTYNEHFSDISVPFSTMIHAEPEMNARLYGQEMNKIFSHPKCRVVLFTSIGLHKYYSLPKSVATTQWQPCTLPDYLLRDDTIWNPNPLGLLYAARLTSIKHPDILAKLTHNNEFLEIVKFVDVYGVAPIWHEENRLESFSPRWNRVKGFYNIYDVPATLEFYKKYRYNWEVFGNRKYQGYGRRLNLSAAEAVAAGQIPIVNPDVAPLWLHDVAVHLDIKDWDENDVVNRLRYIDDHYDSMRSLMRARILESEWSWESVSSRIKFCLTSLME